MPVVGFHMAVAAVLYLQPGCQSTSSTRQSPSQPSATVTSQPGASESETLPPPVSLSRNASPAMNDGWSPRQDSASGGDRARPSTPSWDMADSSGSTREEPTRVAPERVDSSVGSGGPVSYQVRKGDSLWSISRAHDTTVAKIQSLNPSLDGSVLQVGQTILVPGSDSGVVSSPRPQRAVTVVEGVSYEVQKGDTLSGIASRAGTSVAELKALNGLKSDLLRVGQVITLPSGTSAPEPIYEPVPERNPGPAPLTHKVARGETLSGIAARYGISLRQLMEWNGIEKPENLRAGQELLLRNSGGGTVVPRRSSEASAPVQQRSEPEDNKPEEEREPSGNSVNEDPFGDSIFDTAEEVQAVEVEEVPEE